MSVLDTTPSVDISDALSAFAAASATATVERNRSRVGVSEVALTDDDVIMAQSLLDQQIKTMRDQGLQPQQVWVSIPLPGVTPEQARLVFADRMQVFRVFAAQQGLRVRRQGEKQSGPNVLNFRFYQPTSKDGEDRRPHRPI